MHGMLCQSSCPLKNCHANTLLLLEAVPGYIQPFKLGVPLYAPPFFNAANSLEYVSLNNFSAETSKDYNLEVPALSTPAHVVGEGALAMGEKSTASHQLTRCQRKNIKKRAKRLDVEAGCYFP
jgi:hypothetical protein